MDILYLVPFQPFLSLGRGLWEPTRSSDENTFPNTDDKDCALQLTQTLHPQRSYIETCPGTRVLFYPPSMSVRLSLAAGHEFSPPMGLPSLASSGSAALSQQQ